MARPPSIQWYYKQYLGDNDVLKMEWDASGMHAWLLNLSIQEEPPGSIPNDMAVIRRWLRNPSDDVWRRVQPQIFTAWKFRDGRWFNEGMVRSCERRDNYLHRYESGTKNVGDSNKTADVKAFDVDVGFKEEKVCSKSTRIPEEFIPKDAHYTLAAELGVNCEMEFQKFRDYYLGVSGSKSAKRDWDATLRNWLRNSVNYGGRSNGRELTKAQQRVVNSQTNMLADIGLVADVRHGSQGHGARNDAGRVQDVAGDLRRRESKDAGNGVQKLLEARKVLPKAW